MNTITSNPSHAPYILGLDVGTNSIGWAVVDCDISDVEQASHKGILAGYHPTGLRALNARIFQEMVDAKTKVPLNQKRREKRGQRNRLHYYKKRRKQLIQLLLDHQLLPSNFNMSPEQSLNAIDLGFAERVLGKPWSKEWTLNEKAHQSPYAMRHFGLTESLTPHEVGRLLLHLQRRRGYFSNRGAKYIELIKHLNIAAPKDEENDAEGRIVLQGITELAKRLGDQTLGQFIWQQAQQTDQPPQRIRLHAYERPSKKDPSVMEKLYFFAEREMLEHEFDQLIEAQTQHHPVLTDLLESLEHELFHQRPLSSQKSKVGSCNIYPHRKRCGMARLEFQAFRSLQIINNLKLDGQPLNDTQRLALLKLTEQPVNNKTKTLSYRDIAKRFNAKKCNYSLDDGLKGLPANKTALAIIDIIGLKHWQTLSPKAQPDIQLETAQTQLVTDLLTIHNTKDLYNRLVSYWGFSNYDQEGEASEAFRLIMDEPREEGYAKHSLKAINELLPQLRSGLNYYDAVAAIGKRSSITTLHQYHTHDQLLSADAVPNVANPIVQKALFEMRRVVNAICKQYGKPALIRIELGRDVKASKSHRSDIDSQQKANQKRNEAAEAEIAQWVTSNPNIALKTSASGNQRIRLSDRKKYLLWHDEQKEQCPYCQERIGFNQLFSGEAEIEHILPYTGFRQNYMNTMLSCRACNQEKGKRTPYETWGHDSDRWGRIEHFAKNHYTGKLFPKLKNLLKQDHRPEDMDEFVERQLNDTRYIARATKNMLEAYGVPISVNNGTATSTIRKLWGLQNVLPSREQANFKLLSGHDRLEVFIAPKDAKKHRDDHFHHAIDAFVVAMTDGKILQALTKRHQLQQEAKYSKHLDESLSLPDTWQQSQALRKVILERTQHNLISHMVKRKVAGGLHEDTLYGRSRYPIKLSLDTSNPCLKLLVHLTQAPAYDVDGWLPDSPLKNALHQWATTNISLKPDKREAFYANDKPLAKITYYKPCSTTRKALRDWVKNLGALQAHWNPGTKTWVADQRIHQLLFEWLQQHGLTNLSDKAQEKAIQTALAQSPPYMLNQQGQATHPIRRITLASAWSASLVPINDGKAYVPTGANHHCVIFNNGKDPSDKAFERKVKMISVFEAALRISQKRPVVARTAPVDWEGEWHYEMHLHRNDTVEWLDDSIWDTNPNFTARHKSSPYFRVQKMSITSKGVINISFRHHSVSVNEDVEKWGLLHVQSVKKICCRLVNPCNLGLFNDSADD